MVQANFHSPYLNVPAQYSILVNILFMLQVSGNKYPNTGVILAQATGEI